MWTEDCRRPFKYLKTSLTVIPHLACPDVNKPYTLYTDASYSCINACLTQPCCEGEEVTPGIKTEKNIIYLIS